MASRAIIIIIHGFVPRLRFSSHHHHPFTSYRSSLLSHPCLHDCTSFPRVSSCLEAHHRRWNSTASSVEGVGKEEATALQMIDYARSLKGDEASYAEAVRVLEQGLSFFTGDQLSSVNAAGRVQLTLATIHASRNNIGAAIEVLQNLVETTSTSLEVRVAALEALTGLCLQIYQDDAALGHAQRISDFLKAAGDGFDEKYLAALKFQGAALRGLVERVQTRADNNKLLPAVCVPTHFEDVSGAAVLACAEMFHLQGNLMNARDLYTKAIQLARDGIGKNKQMFSAAAMIPEEVHIGALAGLGQLLMHSGRYSESEEKLTEAMKQAELYKGEGHVQVGMVLSCLGELYWRRGKVEGGGDALLTEALYKSALDKLKARPLDQEYDGKEHLDYSELVALTRARLGTTLASLSYRKSEAERLWQWAEAAWKNPRPLAELLSEESLTSSGENTCPTSANEAKKNINTVIDVRLGRVF